MKGETVETPGVDVLTAAMVSDEFDGAACRSEPQLWDLDRRDDSNVVRAVVACYSCPVLDRCARYLATMQPAPEGVIMAGQVLDHPPNRTPRWQRALRMTVARYASA